MIKKAAIVMMLFLSLVTKVPTAYSQVTIKRKFSSQKVNIHLWGSKTLEVKLIIKIDSSNIPELLQVYEELPAWKIFDIRPAPSEEGRINAYYKIYWILEMPRKNTLITYKVQVPKEEYGQKLFYGKIDYKNLDTEIMKSIDTGGDSKLTIVRSWYLKRWGIGLLVLTLILVMSVIVVFRIIHRQISKKKKREQIKEPPEPTPKFLEEPERKLSEEEKELIDKYKFHGLIGRSLVMIKIYEQIERVAPKDSTVLIIGKSGTGKELVAKAIHSNSCRKDKAFMPINCGAIPKELMESELFGHIKGAFTGADRDKKGLFEEADGGTVFLDEVGELPFQLQVKLLRTLDEGEIKRIGENKPRKVDVRIIAATNKDLQKEVEEGHFREDLYYRLYVILLRIPPLCERQEDIPLLIKYFLKGRKIRKDALAFLINFNWKGNIRQLENTIERIAVMSNGTINLKNVKEHIQEESTRKESLGEAKNLFNILMETKWNITEAAKMIDVHPNTVRNRIKRHCKREITPKCHQCPDMTSKRCELNL